jgi:two-component system nitrogen regulation response regulator NtrX
MSLSAQSKVLRAIQERKIERVGGERTIDVDARIVAATNKNLEKECRAGRFREDLFFRLNVVPIELPPLRERADDIPLLMERFLASFGAANLVLEDEAIAMLQRQEWPGNVRELKNLAERIAVMCDGERISAETLGALLQRPSGLSGDLQGNTSNRESGDAGLPGEYLDLDFSAARDLFEKRYIERKLAENGYTISRTAEAVGLYPSNLHAKIRKHGIRTDR